MVLMLLKPYNLVDARAPPLAVDPSIFMNGNPWPDGLHLVDY